MHPFLHILWELIVFFCPLQFHRDPLAAVNACYEGDRVIICPGHYFVDGMFSIADSIELEGSRFASLKILKPVNGIS